MRHVIAVLFMAAGFGLAVGGYGGVRAGATAAGVLLFLATVGMLVDLDETKEQ